MNRKALSLSLLLFLVLLILFVLLLTSRESPPSYTIEVLDIDSGGFTRVTCLNNHGMVAGQVDSSREKGIGGGDSAVSDQLIKRSGFLWKDGETIDIGTLGGKHVTIAAINDAGQVVGSSYIADETASGGTGNQHAFFWSEETGMIDLNQPGEKWGRAWDINNQGQVVGDVTSPEGERYGFIWSGTDEETRAVAGGQATRIRSAFGINNKGQVVGLAEAEGMPDRAFVWSREEGMTLLPSLQTGFDCFATRITDAGQVVGKSSNSSKAWMAVLWDGGQNLFSLCPRYRSCAPMLAINQRGQIVGFDQPWPDGLPPLVLRFRIFLTGSNLASGLIPAVDRLSGYDAETNRGFFWEDGEYHTLLDLIPSESGWSFLSPSDINESGQIAGIGVKDGNTRTFLMTPILDSDEREN